MLKMTVRSTSNHRPVVQTANCVGRRIVYNIDYMANLQLTLTELHLSKGA